MDYAQDGNSQPLSHYEYVLGTDSTNISAWVKPQAFAFMDQLEGWCPKSKAGVLIDLVLKEKPDIIVEIGVFGGKSLVPMACALKANEKGKIIGIDPWSSQASIEGSMNEVNKAWWAALDHEAIMRGLIRKIRQFDLVGQVELIKSTSAAAPAINGIDILHVDGNHSEETSYLDVTKWVPLMKSGGWVIFDDMTWYENQMYTTSKAVAWLNQNCIKFSEFTDDSTWGIWIKP